MNRIKHVIALAAAATLLTGAFALASSARAEPPSPGADAAAATIDDSVITTKVQAALKANMTLENAGSIHVKTSNGVVRLYGVAESQADATTAENLARAVQGVRGVTNALSIVNHAG
jgi:hyperosmotically inducible periplasmic protein